MKRARKLDIFVGIVLFVNNLAFGMTIKVPEDYVEIQTAIDISVHGDTILVAPGIYSNPINFMGKSITVRSDIDGDPTTYDISPEMTIIEADQQVVSIRSGENDAVIDGFTLRNGNPGIDVLSLSNATISNCIIASNSAGGGGGSSVWFHAFATFINCTFTGNEAGSGGGLDVGDSSAVTMINCTFSGNSAGTGGAIYVTESSSATLTNCIFWENIADRGHQIAIDNESIATVKYCDVQGGQREVSVDQTCGLDWVSGTNIDADPQFVYAGYWDPNGTPNDPEYDLWIDGDYHLRSEAGRWDPNSGSWVIDDVMSPCIDAGDPNSPVAFEPEPNGGRINMGAYGGTDQASMSPSQAETVVHIKWIGHSSVKIWTDDAVVYVDPRLFNDSPHDANLVLVTHSHGDHYSRTHILRASNENTAFYAPPDVIRQHGSGTAIAPGETIESSGVLVTGVPAYNTNKPNHPKSNNWLGYVVELGGKRIYVAGDTDLIEEMRDLENIDVAILPVGGTYTMNGREAAQATTYIQPDLAIPYHWGSGIGNINDAQTFAEQAACPVIIMTQGQTISSDNWLE